ncbi:MAG: substrate-binding domain-containing protein [Geothrix sp.]|nr:substrate-binding domain-containing protein [Geothrix sp.]
MRRFILAICTTCLAFAQTQILRMPKVDPAIPTYVSSGSLTGTIESIGADSLADVWDEWQQAFRAQHPGVQFKVVQTLSKTALDALMAGTVPLIHMAREMTIPEYQAFEKKWGYPPTKVLICFDAFIVFVNSSNPIKEIGMDQLDAVLSTTRAAGYPKDIETWGDLGGRGDWAKRPIHVYFRAEGTASWSVVKDLVLQKGTFKPKIIDKPDYPSIADAVLTDANGLAIGTLATWYSRNRTLAVIPLQGRDALMPTQENVTSGRYPMSKGFFLYVNHAPGKALPPVLAEFLNFALSREGQQAVAQSSLYPLPADLAAMNRRRLRSN